LQLARFFGSGWAGVEVVSYRCPAERALGFGYWAGYWVVVHSISALACGAGTTGFFFC